MPSNPEQPKGLDNQTTSDRGSTGSSPSRALDVLRSGRTTRPVLIEQGPRFRETPVTSPIPVHLLDNARRGNVYYTPSLTPQPRSPLGYEYISPSPMSPQEDMQRALAISPQAHDHPLHRRAVSASRLESGHHQFQDVKEMSTEEVTNTLQATLTSIDLNRIGSLLEELVDRKDKNLIGSPGSVGHSKSMEMINRAKRIDHDVRAAEAIDRRLARRSVTELESNMSSKVVEIDSTPDHEIAELDGDITRGIAELGVNSGNEDATKLNKQSE